MYSPSICEGIDQSRSQAASVLLYRDPTKNHNALVKINNKHSHDFSVIHGVLKFEIFTLNRKEDTMDFVNLAKTISASDDKEVLGLEIQSYRDAKHIQEFVKSMESDRSVDKVYEEFIKLVTSNSIVSYGYFSKLNEIS